MPTLTEQFITSVELFYLDSFADDAHITYWQAFDPLTSQPVGPEGGDVNPAYVRLWMTEMHPAAMEVRIVKVVMS